MMELIRNLWRTKLLPQIALIVTSAVVIMLLLTIVLSHIEMKRQIGFMEYELELIGIDLRKLIPKCQPDNRELFNSMRRIKQGEVMTKSNVYNKLDEFESSLKLLKNSVQELELQSYLDGTGRADFALESAGGRIISIGNTKLLSSTNVWNLFVSHFIVKPGAVTLNGPRNIIQPTIYPGECFAFVGLGEVSIKLIRKVFIDTISIEHILPEMSVDGTIFAAPNQFTVFGRQFENDTSAVSFGTFFYDIRKRRPIQEFRMEKPIRETCFSIVDFKFLSNHGHKHYTCVYRIRVHGSINKPD